MPDPKIAARPPVKLGAPVQVANRSRGPGTVGSAVDDTIRAIMDDEPPAEPAAQAEAPVKPAAKAEAPPEPVAPVKQEDPGEPDVPGIPNDVMLAPEPAPKAQALADDDADEPPPSRDPKANEAWAKVKRQRRELRDKVTALESEVERMRTNQTPDLSEVKKLQEQVAEYEAKIGQYDLASTKSFKLRFDAPVQAAIQKGVALLTRSGKDPEAAKATVRKLISMASNGEVDSEAVQQALSDEPYAVQGALLLTVSEYADAAKARQEALAKWSDTRAAIAAQTTVDHEVTLTEHIERDVPVAVNNALKAGNFMYAQSKDNQAWNEGVQSRVQAVKGILRASKSEELVRWVAEGVTAKDTRDLLASTRAAYLKVKGELDRIVGAAPRLAADSTGVRRAPANDGKPKDINQVLDETFADAERRVFR